MLSESQVSLVPYRQF